MAVAALVAEVTKARDAIAERDEALLRASSERTVILDRASTLQLMLAADKAVGVLSRVAWGSALAALCHWRHVVVILDGADESSARAAELLVYLRAADESTAEASARLEAEEVRRSEAERLAFDEGRRRRRAEEACAAAESQLHEARGAAEARVHEVRAASAAQVQQAHAAAEEEKQQVHAAIEERLQQASAQVASELDRAREAMCECFSTVLAARRDKHAMTQMLCTWRVFAATAHQQAMQRQALAEMATERKQNDASARSTAEALATQLRAAQREASEAQLLVLSARQQRAEALAKAAAEEEQRLEGVAREERCAARHAKVLEQLGGVAGAAATRRCLGPCVRRWAQLAAARRARAQTTGSAAAMHSKLQSRLEAAVHEAGVHAAALAEARAESAHADAEAAERLHALSARAGAERARAAVEGRGLLCGELDELEKALARSEHARSGGVVGLGEREWRRRHEAHFRASLRHWARLASRRRIHTLRAHVEQAQKAAADASTGLERRAAAASRARARWARATAHGDARFTAAVVLGAWRHAAAAARRKAEAAAEATQLEALEQQLRQQIHLTERLSMELQQSQAMLSARIGELEAARTRADARADASERHVAELERAAAQAAQAAMTEVRDLRVKLAAAEQQAKLESARASRAEEAILRLEEDVQAAELRALWNTEQAAQQASLIHEQLHETLVPSPRAPPRRVPKDVVDE